MPVKRHYRWWLYRRLRRWRFWESEEEPEP